MALIPNAILALNPASTPRSFTDEPSYRNPRYSRALLNPSPSTCPAELMSHAYPYARPGGAPVNPIGLISPPAGRTNPLSPTSILAHPAIVPPGLIPPDE